MALKVKPERQNENIKKKKKKTHTEFNRACDEYKVPSKC